MRAFLIDPKTLTVEPFEHDETLAQLYERTGCDQLEIIRRVPGFSVADSIYVDENVHMRRDGPKVGKFTLKGLPTVIYGRAIVSGHTDDGDMCSPNTQLETVRKRVVFLSRGS